MAVLAIIVMLGAAAIPSLQSGMSHLKLARALDAFVNQIEFARTQAAARNRAYRMIVMPGQGETRGRVILTEAWGTVCNETSFTETGGFKPVERVRDLDFTHLHAQVMISGVTPSSLIPPSLDDDSTGLCFKPDGRVLQVSSQASGGGGVPLPAVPGYGAGEAVYRLTLMGADGSMTQDSISRVVVVPYNGIPRVESP